MRRPTVSQTASAASSRPGNSSTGRMPTNPSAAVSPGVSAMPCTARRALARQRLRARVVAAAAGAADGDDGVGAFRRQHAAEIAAGLVEPRRAAAAFDIGGHRARGGDDDAAAAQRHHAHARLAHGHARQTRGGESGKIGGAQALAGMAQRNARIAVAARRQARRRRD